MKSEGEYFSLHNVNAIIQVRGRGIKECTRLCGFTSGCVMGIVVKGGGLPGRQGTVSDDR